MMQDLLKRQSQLNALAGKVLTDLNMLDLLKEIGTTRIIGSMALNLMVWRDIDIEVIVQDPQKDLLKDIITKLIEKSLRRIDFSIIDNRAREKEHLPQGIYLGIKYTGPDVASYESISNNDKIWKIDIWFLKEENSQGAKATQQIKEKLTDEKINYFADKRKILEPSLIQKKVYKYGHL
jgi:hypothetical protein